MNEIAKFAADNNLDASALECLVSFLRRVALEHPSEFMKNPTAFVEAGVKAWHEKGVSFYQELLEGTTERAKKYHQEIAHAVWENANRK
jgi:hypothetical protein